MVGLAKMAFNFCVGCRVITRQLDRAVDVGAPRARGWILTVPDCLMARGRTSGLNKKPSTALASRVPRGLARAHQRGGLLVVPRAAARERAYSRTCASLALG